MLAATTHLGSDNSEVQMEQYIFKRRQDGVHIINLKKTWEKLMLAARAIAAIENPADVFVVSARPYGQRAVLKFTRYITGKCCSRSVFQSPTAMLHEFSMIQIQSAK